MTADRTAPRTTAECLVSDPLPCIHRCRPRMSAAAPCAWILLAVALVVAVWGIVSG